MKIQLHILHTNGIWLVCTFLWLLFFAACLNEFWHCGLSPVWARRWRFKGAWTIELPFTFWTFNRWCVISIMCQCASVPCFVYFCYQTSLIILHIEQLKGLSPVYFILCIFKCSNLLNESPHCPQGNRLPLHYDWV